MPDEPEGLVSSSTHRKCTSLREWLLEGLNNHEPSLYRSRSLPPGYSFRFVRSLGRILLCHDNGVVVLDTPEVQPGAWGSMHLSFLYGPLEIFLDTVLRTSADQLEVEPSNTVGMAGCIPVLVPEPGTPRCTGSDDFALARALDPETANLAASARAAAGARPLFRRSRSAVPAQAPLRPKGSSMEICLEQANLKAFAHLLQRNTSDAFTSKTLSDGATTPLIYALDRLRKTPWDCSKSLMSLNSMIVRLIENRANVNALVPPEQESPLQLLLRASHTEGELVHLCKSRLAVVMLQQKAEVNHVDRNGESPLSEAAMAGDVEMCRLLLDHGANICSLKATEHGWKTDLSDLSLDRKVQLLLKDAEMRQNQRLSDLISLGRSHLSSKSSSRAQLCFLQALKLDPLNPELLLAAAEADFLQGAFEKAYRDASKVVALCPLNGAAYELCARSLWHLNRLDEALCVCSMVPSDAKQKVVTLEERMVRHSKCYEAVQEMLKEVSNQQNLGLLEKSFKDLDGLLCDMDEVERGSAWGSRISLAFAKVCLFPSLGLLPEQLRKCWAQRALSETRHLRKREPSHGEILYWHARALLQTGCRQDALNAFSCASQLGCSAASALLQGQELCARQRATASAAALQGDWAEARRRYAEAEEAIDSGDPELLVALLTEKSLALLKLGHASLALEDLTRALTVGPASAMMHYRRGVANMALEQYQQAAFDFDAAIQLDPKVHPEVQEDCARARRWSQYPPVPDHYEALGVKKNASNVQLKKAYRLAALQWHPDKNVGQEAMAEQAFKQIQQAFEILSDERRRKDYDQYPGDRKPVDLLQGDDR